MICFGTHMFNEVEILRVDLWYTPNLAKVYFVDNEPVTLDEDATLEARQYAEDTRRQLRIQDEIEVLDLDNHRYWAAHAQKSQKRRAVKHEKE